jgi:hypothetical protein
LIEKYQLSRFILLRTVNFKHITIVLFHLWLYYKSCIIS